MTKEITRGMSFEQKRKKPGLNFNPRLVLIGHQTTGPWNLKDNNFMYNN